MIAFPFVSCYVQEISYQQYSVTLGPFSPIILPLIHIHIRIRMLKLTLVCEAVTSAVDDVPDALCARTKGLSHSFVRKFFAVEKRGHLRKRQLRHFSLTDLLLPGTVILHFGFLRDQPSCFQVDGKGSMSPSLQDRRMALQGRLQKCFLATKKLRQYLVVGGALHLSLIIALRKRQLRHFSVSRPCIRRVNGKF